MKDYCIRVRAHRDARMLHAANTNQPLSSDERREGGSLSG